MQCVCVWECVCVCVCVIVLTKLLTCSAASWSVLLHDLLLSCPPSAVQAMTAWVVSVSPSSQSTCQGPVWASLCTLHIAGHLSFPMVSAELEALVDEVLWNNFHPDCESSYWTKANKKPLPIHNMWLNVLWSIENIIFYFILFLYLPHHCKSVIVCCHILKESL